MRSRATNSSVVHRTARVALRVTPAQARRCYGLLRAGGDVWATLIDYNAERVRRHAPMTVTYRDLCREVAGVKVGELSTTALRSVVKRYAEAAAETLRRRARGERARFPRRRRALMPLRWYAGNFRLEQERLRVSVARGAPDLWLRLTHPIPYPPEEVRSVTLLADAGRLYVDVTAEVPIDCHDLDQSKIAGVDLGIIYPFVVASADEALAVSGRALRAEERVHLADTKARARRMGRKAPRRGQSGSRRWRKLRAKQREAEARHRRKIRQAHHEAAKTIVQWAVARGVGTIVIGDPKGITSRDVGRRQNRRLRQWRRGHLTKTLVDKAEQAGMLVVRVNERGTSSTCPGCGVHHTAVGRVFACPNCNLVAHRDVVGATNIAATRGGSTNVPTFVTHRRAGTVPLRRDRRRHLMDCRRSCPALGRPRNKRGSRSSVAAGDCGQAATPSARSLHATPDEEQRTGLRPLLEH